MAVYFTPTRPLLPNAAVLIPGPISKAPRRPLRLISVSVRCRRRGATSDAGRSGQIRARAQERSVRRRVDLDIFGHVFKVAPSLPRRGRKQSVVSRQGIVPAVAVFRIQPKVDIKFLSEFWSDIASAWGQRLTPIRSCPGCNLEWRDILRSMRSLHQTRGRDLGDQNGPAAHAARLGGSKELSTQSVGCGKGIYARLLHLSI
jgi:hypothetical protein